MEMVNWNDESYDKNKIKDTAPSTLIDDRYEAKDTVLQWGSHEDYISFLISSDFEDTFEPQHQYGPDYIIPTDNQIVSEIWDVVKLRSTMIETIPQLSIVTTFQQTVSKFPNRVALGVKRNNKWIEWTYTDYWKDVCTVAKGFIKLGLDQFKAVGILGWNSPEWAISLLGGIYAGGVSTGIYTTNSPEACHYILEDSSAQIVVVENDLQLQKVLKIRNRLPQLKAIIQYTGEPTEIGVLSWNDLLAIGRNISDDLLNRRIKNLAINQCCILIYTSGTTGQPKGAMINHDNILYIANLVQWVAKFPAGNEKVLSYLPLSHVASQLSDIHASYSNGNSLYFANEDALKGNLIEYLRDVRPTYLIGVPRIWEKVVDKLKEKENELSAFKKKIFKWARKQALHYHLTQQTNGNRQSLLYNLAKRLVLKKVRMAIGLQKAILISSGGANLNADILKYLASIDIKLTESYGMTESCGPNTLHYYYPFKIGSVGKILTDLEFKTDNPNEDKIGEICTRGRHVFMGYLNQLDKTKEVIDENRWLHTGDNGYIDSDNYLYITGRIKEIIITSGGENVAPVPIEERVKKNLPIISNCMLIGDGKKHLSMFLTLKVEVIVSTMQPTDKLLPEVQEWCRSIGSKANTIQDILLGPDINVFQAVQTAINKVNEDAISNAQRIQKWVILPKDFCITEGEFGPTMKLKRQYILTKYKTAIDSMYRQ